MKNWILIKYKLKQHQYVIYNGHTSDLSVSVNNLEKK